MDMKVYRKTRYQNIYQHIKNKNYVISMSKPVKTSISRIENKKITALDEALKIRDNVLIKQQKALEMLHKEDFDTLWEKYIYDCKYVQKQAYNTLQRKIKIYNKFFKDKFDIPLSKTTKEFWADFLEELETTLKNKNHILVILNAFLNWCVDNNKLLLNPAKKIKRYKVSKTEMKFWTPEELSLFLKTVQNDLSSPNLKTAYKAYRIYVFTIIGFSSAGRTGESRALRYLSFVKKNTTLDLGHSINYDPNSNEFIKTPKTKESEEYTDISEKVFQVVDDYRNFLESKMEFDVKDSDLLFYNYNSQKPYSDTNLRKHFHYYCDKANVSKIRMYDLRHTYVATMMSDGRDISLISKKLRHRNISTTVDEYGHLSNKIRKELAQATDKYI